MKITFKRGLMMAGMGALLVGGAAATAVAYGGHGYKGFGGGHGFGGGRGAMMEQMFDTADTDGDGKISEAEFTAARAERMAGIDADEDGTVTFEEMQAHRDAMRAQRQLDRFLQLDRDGDGKVSVEELAARAERHFVRMDRNDDGVIDKDEIGRDGPRGGYGYHGHHGMHGGKFGGMQGGYGHHGMHGGMHGGMYGGMGYGQNFGPGRGMQGMFDSFDADDDGAVTEAEIEAGMAARAAEIDADGDGKITATELQDYRYAQRAARQEARLLRLDTDKDGAVSVEEFAAARGPMFGRMDRDGDGRIERSEMGKGFHRGGMGGGMGYGMHQGMNRGGDCNR